MKTLFKLVTLSLLFLFFSLTIHSQDDQAPILFIYDASGSMWGKLDQKTKMSVAADVLSSSVKNLGEEQRVGLMAYGHRREKDCDDVEMLVNLENSSKTKITSAVSSIKPLGRTPLARSAKKAIDYLSNKQTKATIILITDGIESCDGNICNVVAEAKANGIEFRLHIVGFGLKEENTDQLRCAASAGNGNYFEANDASGLSDVINEAVNETVEDIDNNVSIYALKNGEPIDAWIRAKTKSQNKYEGLSRTYRDTAFMYLAPGEYDVLIEPLEGTDISAREIVIEITKNKVNHQDVSFDGSKLNVFTSNNGEGCDATVRIYNSSTNKIVATCRTYGREQLIELDPGNYRIEFKALKIEGMETVFDMTNIQIEAGDSKEFSHDFETGLAFIGAQTSKGELIDATVYISDLATGKSVAGARTYTSESSNPKQFILNPGKYLVKMNTLGVHKGHQDSFEIEVIRGEETRIVKKF